MDSNQQSAQIAHINPYEQLDSQAFWKTAVAVPLGAKPLDEHFLFERLWRAKFTLTKQTAFATAGSCFAQHISRWLMNNDYAWLDSEPANGYMSADDRKAGHYGVFSFRTGNIYTAALLKQWVFWALGKQNMPDEVFEDKGIYYDPFRPSIPTQGYANLQDLYDDRVTTLSAIRKALEQIDVFIFTLGLTEAWYHIEHHYVYPHCPGTIKGRFDATQHQFVNYGVTQIKQELLDAFDAIKAVNPQCRFILTVSPVPLTATASGDHVLSATIYSKSVLRAVAGELAAQYDDIDYFPSYELISAYPIKAHFYEKNLRSVKQEGVDFVMQHFSRALADYRSDDTDNLLAEGDVFCEELMLQRYAKHQQEQQKSSSEINKDYEVLVFGDSHMGRLADSLTLLKVNYVGDHIMDASQWHKSYFVPDNEEYFVPLQNKMSRELWRKSLAFFNSYEHDNKKIITNISVQSDAVIQALVKILAHNGKDQELSLQEMKAFFYEKNKGNLEIFTRFIKEGYHVIVISDPPVQSYFEQTKHLVHLFERYERAMMEVLSELNVSFFWVRDYFNNHDFPDYYVSENPKDWIHGSQDYYDEVALAICAIFGISVPFKLDDLPENMSDVVERIKCYINIK